MATKPKIRITINIDADVLEYFKTLATNDDRPYQPLMNRVLRNFVERAKKADKDVADYKSRV